MRLLGLHLERLAHVGLGLAPLLGALLADAAIVIGDPGVLVGRRRQHVDRPANRSSAQSANFLRPRSILPSAMMASMSLGSSVGDVLQDLDRLVAAVGGVEIGGELDLRVALQRRIGRHPLIDLDRHRRLLHRLIEIGERQQRQRMVGLQIERELQIDQRQILAAAAGQRRADAVQRLGGAGLRRYRSAAAASCRPWSRAAPSCTSGCRGSFLSNAS